MLIKLGESIKAYKESQQKTINAYWWMFGICAATLTVLILVFIQVVRTVKLKDPVFLLMLFFLQLTLVA